MVSIKQIIPVGGTARVELSAEGGAVEGTVLEHAATYVVLALGIGAGKVGIRYSEIVRAFPLGVLVPGVVA